MSEKRADTSNPLPRTSTPVRAIVSTLTNRASPLVPPSTQTYEPLVKSVLRQRLLRNIFVYSALLSWLIAVVWTVWERGGGKGTGAVELMLTPFLPLTILNGVLHWVFVALPVIVVRKVFLTASRTSATSPSSLASRALSKPSTRPALIAYAMSALFIAVFHVIMAYANENLTHEDPKLTLFVKSKKHPHYLNGRLIFLIISQIMMGAAFLARNLMIDRFVFPWHATVIVPPRNALGLYELVKTATIAFVFATLIVPISAITFATIRLLLPILYKLPLLHIFLRPFTAHFLRGSWTMLLPFRHFTLLCRAWFVSFTTIVIWEFSESVFETSVTQPIYISQSTPDPNTSLVSGIKSLDKTFRHFAYTELKSLATDDSSSAVARRTSLFSDQKGSSNLWPVLVRESLLLLGQDYQLFLARGQPPAQLPPVAPVQTKAPLSDRIPATPTPLLRKRIFRDSATTQDLEGSNGVATSTIINAVESVTSVPELFRSIGPGVVLTPKKEGVEPVAEVATSQMQRWRNNVVIRIQSELKKFIPCSALELWSTWTKWWEKERISKKVEMTLPSRELDVLVIEVLSRLVCSSLNEDRYGVVQRDIPRILEAMLSFLTAIETYRAEISPLYKIPLADDQLTLTELEEREAVRIEVEKAGEVLGFVGDGLKEGVVRIVQTFGTKILAFKFPPRVAQKLQGFIDYC